MISYVAFAKQEGLLVKGQPRAFQLARVNEFEKVHQVEGPSHRDPPVDRQTQ